MNAIVNPLDPGNPLPARTLVVVGMPGSGKTTVAKKLAKRLMLAFTDSDAEVEASAGMKIDKIFEKLGEPAFRQGERKIIARFLEDTPRVLATGGGAFMDNATRALIRERATSIWLRADIRLLLERTGRRNDRPLLKRGDPESILRELLAAREPVYAEADIVVDAASRPVHETVELVLKALDAYTRERQTRKETRPV